MEIQNFHLWFYLLACEEVLDGFDHKEAFTFYFNFNANSTDHYKEDYDVLSNNTSFTSLFLAITIAEQIRLQ